MLSMLAPKVFNKKNLSFCIDFKIKNNSTKEACRFELRPSWSTNRVTGQPGLLEKTLSFGDGRRKKKAYIVLRVYSIL